MEYTLEMSVLFYQRTTRHISLVSKYIIEMVYHYGLSGTDLLARKDNHDSSKFKEPEKTPYVLIAWQYHCRDLGIDFFLSENDKNAMTAATYHHVTTNSHHPEYHSKGITVISRENRDAPSGILVDATAMPDLDICEMVADWLAMSEEKRTNVKDWADKNIGTRWEFSNEQVNRIYNIINAILKG
jgi:hypothetical protein